MHYAVVQKCHPSAFAAQLGQERYFILFLVHIIFHESNTN